MEREVKMAKKKGDTEKFEDGLGILMGAYDWQAAMEYAKFKFEDIKTVISAVEGENDGADWQLVVELKSGKFAWLSASCDYSGWDCQAGGESGVCDSQEDAFSHMKLYKR